MDRLKGTAKCSGIPWPEPGAGEFALVLPSLCISLAAPFGVAHSCPFRGPVGSRAASVRPPPPPFYPIPHPTPPLGGRGGHAGWRPFFSGDSETYSRA